MINVTPISIAATAQSYAAELTEKLCQPYCVNASIQPVVDVTYTIDDTSLVGTTLYVTVKAQGTVNYVPKCGIRATRRARFSPSISPWPSPERPQLPPLPLCRQQAS